MNSYTWWYYVNSTMELISDFFKKVLSLPFPLIPFLTIGQVFLGSCVFGIIIILLAKIFRG